MRGRQRVKGGDEDRGREGEGGEGEGGGKIKEKERGRGRMERERKGRKVEEGRVSVGRIRRAVILNSPQPVPVWKNPCVCVCVCVCVRARARLDGHGLEHHLLFRGRRHHLSAPPRQDTEVSVLYTRTHSHIRFTRRSGGLDSGVAHLQQNPCLNSGRIHAMLPTRHSVGSWRQSLIIA